MPFPHPYLLPRSFKRRHLSGVGGGEVDGNFTLETASPCDTLILNSCFEVERWALWYRALAALAELPNGASQPAPGDPTPLASVSTTHVPIKKILKILFCFVSKQGLTL